MEAQLINRLKGNLEWLAQRMPEKFVFTKMNNEFFNHWHFYLKEDYIRFEEGSGDEWANDYAVVFFLDEILNKIHVEPDPLSEFSNSLSRIAYVAFGEIMFFPNSLVVEFVKNKDIKKILLDAPDSQLSQQVQALCIRIEQERRKK